MNTPLDKTANQPESTDTSLTVLDRFGRVLFALAIIGMGVATLIVISGHSPGSQKFVRVIPWPDAIPSLVYPTGAILLLCGVGLLFRRSVLVSSIILGVVMLLGAFAFDVPRSFDVMSPSGERCARPIGHRLPGMARGSRHSRTALHTCGPLSDRASLSSLHRRTSSGSAPIATMVGPTGSLAPILGRLHTASPLDRCGVSFAIWLSAAWAGFRSGTDVRDLARTAPLSSVLNYLHNPGRASRPGQVVGRRVHRRGAGRFLGDSRHIEKSRLPAPA